MPLTPRATSNNMRIQHISISKLAYYILINVRCVLSQLKPSALSILSCEKGLGLQRRPFPQLRMYSFSGSILYVLKYFFKAEVQLAILENPIPEINRVTSVNSACEDLKAANNTFKISFCITCKTKKPKTSTKTAIPKPWFDDSCKESRKKYKSAKNRYKHTKTTADLVSMRNSSRVYKRCRPTRRSVVKYRRTEAKRIKKP